MQLALLVLRERGRAPWAPFLHSWPSEAPALPESLDDATLEREAPYLPCISRVSPVYLPC